MTTDARELPLQADDGHRWSLLARLPAQPRASLLWLPALGVSARNYLPFADALAARGIAVFLHEWRGFGSSSLRASRECDWGYHALLTRDLPASEAAIAQALPGLERLIGGHSLGGQLACCRLTLQPQAARRLWLAASGAPYWRAFPLPHRLWLPLAYRFLPWLAARRGSLPGRTIGFGGNEARGVIGDWARTALSGRYAAAGLDTDLEAALPRVTIPVQAVVLRDDWLCPESSLRFLLSKLRPVRSRIVRMDADDLQARADHFTWLQHPDAIARTLVEDLSIARG
ncbi:alpha/beta hydrolase family protein [Luteimonas suaedae]|uniref:alpha/beta hydrolase family protein n=1 Tax=Luteimonas suaedae TaxID=2605430 RepID=UPI0011EBCEE4|nr:alpha/beta fold hydrolase [Luteimonas suaedae]